MYAYLKSVYIIFSEKINHLLTAADVAVLLFMLYLATHDVLTIYCPLSIIFYPLETFLVRYLDLHVHYIEWWVRYLEQSQDRILLFLDQVSPPACSAALFFCAFFFNILRSLYHS
jgi:hypothetical protein